MWPRLVVFDEPGIEIGLQLGDGAIEPLAERHTIELIEQRLVEALANSVRLRAPRFGAGVIDVLDGEIKLILVALGPAAILGAAIGQHAADHDLVLVKE